MKYQRPLFCELDMLYAKVMISFGFIIIHPCPFLSILYNRPRLGGEGKRRKMGSERRHFFNFFFCVLLFFCYFCMMNTSDNKKHSDKW